MPDAGPRVLSAQQATSLLGVSRQTLYSYVSRGLVRALEAPGRPGRSLYDAQDIAALIERRRRGRSRRDVAASTTDWGEPILRSSLTLIAAGRFSYRGQDVVTLAETATLEEVAGLLWALPMPVIAAPEAAASAGAEPFERCLRAIALEAAHSTGAQHPPMFAAEATRLLGLMTQAATGRAFLPGIPVHAQIAASAGLDETGADMVRRALVLCADHELNASAFAARVVASTGASLAACILAGLAALSGPLHGGMTGRTLALAADPEVLRDPIRALGLRLARGETLPGFGHRLYPQGDPRAAALLSAMVPQSPWRDIIAAADAVTSLRPNVDFALAMLEHRLPLRRGGGLALFAIGRTVGWIAHALEQRAEGKLIRPRAEHAPASAACPVVRTPDA